MASTWRCSRCGRDVAVRITVCPRCGHRKHGQEAGSGPTSERRCPNGHPVPPADRYCGVCGTLMPDEAGAGVAAAGAHGGGQKGTQVDDPWRCTECGWGVPAGRAACPLCGHPRPGQEPGPEPARSGGQGAAVSPARTPMSSPRGGPGRPGTPVSDLVDDLGVGWWERHEK